MVGVGKRIVLYYKDRKYLVREFKVNNDGLIVNHSSQALNYIMMGWYSACVGNNYELDKNPTNTPDCIGQMSIKVGGENLIIHYTIVELEIGLQTYDVAAIAMAIEKIN